MYISQRDVKDTTILAEILQILSLIRLVFAAVNDCWPSPSLPRACYK